jgi:hypothetical protein
VATNLYGKSCTPNTGGVLDFYTKSEVNSLLASKAGTSTIYTRAYIDGQLSTLSNSIASLSASSIDQTDLDTALSALQTEIESDVAATYATLAGTYTKSQVDSLISTLDLDPDTLLRKVPSTTATNTVDPGANNAVALTLHGSSTNAIVQQWLDSSGDIIGYISNSGTATLEGSLTLGRLVSDGSAALIVSNKRITGLATPTIGADAVSLNYLRYYTQYYYEQVTSPSPDYEFQVTQIRTLIDVVDTGGDGSLLYDNTTGVFTYTGPSASEVRAHFSGGTGVTITNGSIAIGQSVATTANVTFSDLTLTGTLYGPNIFYIDPVVEGQTNSGTVVIRGDLQVDGTTTTVNSTTLTVEDKNIELGTADTPADTTADGGGITLRGTSDKSITWLNSTDAWTFSDHIDLANGKGFYINGTSVLNATTLGSGVTGSSLTGLGTVTTGTWQASTIGIGYGGTGQTSYVDGELLIGKTVGNTLVKATLSGGTGIDITNGSGSISIDIDSTVVTTNDSGTVTSTMIENGTIVDEDINASAEIAVSKLANGTARQLLQTNAAGTSVEWTGNIDVPGTLDVTDIATFDNLISIGAAEPTTSQQVGWNVDKGTLDVGLLNDVISPLGQDIITLCRNGTVSTIAKGTAVMFAGTIGNSGKIKIAPMISDGTYPGYVFFGVTAQSIAAGADGYVKSFGEIKGINTNIDEGGVDGQWAEGDILWCDPATPGGFTKVEPEAPNLKLPVAAVVSVGNNGIVMVRWDTGRRLSDLHDVESNGSTTNGELLIYNSSASRWEHGTSVPSLEVTESLVVNGIEIIDSARDIEESRLIRRNATVSIGVAGTVPFGVGPVIPPGMSLVGIGPDAYNVIDIYSGSIC